MAIDGDNAVLGRRQPPEQNPPIYIVSLAIECLLAQGPDPSAHAYARVTYAHVHARSAYRRRARDLLGRVTPPCPRGAEYSAQEL